SSAGAALDPTGFPVAAKSGVTEDQPAVGWDGANFLVVWSVGTAVNAVRVSPSAAILDATPITIVSAAKNQEFPAVGFGAANYLVVWEAFGSNTALQGSRMTPAGAVLDATGISV